MSFKIEYQPASCAFHEFHELDVECFPEEPITAEAFARFVTHDFWAAYDGNSLVGYSYVVCKPDVAWLSRIGTAEECRNRGVATRLMESVVDHCSHIGLADIILYVQSDNHSAIRLYERFGFRTIESAYQFVLRVAELPGFITDDSKEDVEAIPITEISESSWPNFPREWRNIIEMHKPPNNHVLVFHDRVGNTIPYFSPLSSRSGGVGCGCKACDRGPRRRIPCDTSRSPKERNAAGRAKCNAAADGR